MTPTELELCIFTLPPEQLYAGPDNTVPCDIQASAMHLFGPRPTPELLRGWLPKMYAVDVSLEAMIARMEGEVRRVVSEKPCKQPECKLCEIALRDAAFVQRLRYLRGALVHTRAPVPWEHRHLVRALDAARRCESTHPDAVDAPKRLRPQAVCRNITHFNAYLTGTLHEP